MTISRKPDDDDDDDDASQNCLVNDLSRRLTLSAELSLVRLEAESLSSVLNEPPPEKASLELFGSLAFC